MILKKIFFDEQGNIGTIIGSDILPLKSNEKLICSEEEAQALGLGEGQHMTLEELRTSDSPMASDAYDTITRFKG